MKWRNPSKLKLDNGLQVIADFGLVIPVYAQWHAISERWVCAIPDDKNNFSDFITDSFAKEKLLAFISMPKLNHNTHNDKDTNSCLRSSFVNRKGRRRKVP